MTKDRQEEQDISLEFMFSTFNDTHDIFFSGWIKIFFNKLYCVSVPDENRSSSVTLWSDPHYIPVV